MHLHIYIYVYIFVLIIVFYLYMSISILICVCIGDIFTLHQPPLLHPTLGPSARPSVRRMGTKSATPRRSGADTVHATMWGWFSTRVFGGSPCHQPSTNKGVLLGLRVEGYPIIHEVSHVFWNFHLAKVGKWNPI